MEPGISSAGRPVSTPTDTFLSIDFLAELFFSKEFAQALTVNAARSRQFSFTELDSWTRTSFSSSPSWVLASWSLFLSCCTLISTFSPAFSWRSRCCLSGSSPAPSAILLSDYTHTPHFINYFSFRNMNYQRGSLWLLRQRLVRPQVGPCILEALGTGGYSSV